MQNIFRRAVIDFVDSGDPFAWRGYVYAAAMFCLGVFCPVVFHRHLLITCQVGLRCKTALTSAIYRKALRLSPVAKRQRTTGEIVNLMSIDAQQVQDTVTWLHYSWYETFKCKFSLWFGFQRYLFLLLGSRLR